MRLIKMDKATETMPVILSVVRDAGWCYSSGIISVIAVIPVLTFQVYETWKCRKDGMHKVMHNIVSLIGMTAGSCWMISDLFFHSTLQTYVKWIFNVSFLFLGLFFIFSYRQSKVEKKKGQAQRMMTISKQARGIVFVHGKLAHLRKPASRGHRTVMVRPRIG